MSGHGLSEADICAQRITPAIQAAGWRLDLQIRQEVTLTPGRISVRGMLASRDRSGRKRADYVLYHRPNIPLAVVEAKDDTHPIGAGMPQALAYAGMLGVPFAFSSNGDGFLFHDQTAEPGKTETGLSMDEFPRPELLWERYLAWRGLQPVGASSAEALAEDYHDGGGKEPRYYQSLAVNRAVEAVANGQNRILLVMATGTGKTYTAFQIIWRLRQAQRVNRVLYLADRNILIDQTMINDFKPFGPAMTKIRGRRADKAYEVYLTLYQAISGKEAKQNIYKEFSPGFFDLVVIDECHRGSADEDAVWREILEYFSSAIQIGMTATPKETKYASNIHYFGPPVFTYSLKQGIEDGFLAPYRVVRIDLDRDLLGWRPESGRRDDRGHEIEDRTYDRRDMDNVLILEQRTGLVAAKVAEFLQGTDPFAKTIVFCETIEHAERMRSALVNAVGDLARDNDNCIVRITGDNPEGKLQLDSFIDPEQNFPVVATTSRLMSTGVDAKTCKLIVIDQTINSLTTFKQIIGRGTRIDEDYNKHFFTIMDFKGATRLFSDPAFDGDPIDVFEPGEGESPVPPVSEGEDAAPPGSGPLPDPPEGDSQRLIYYVQDVKVEVLAERVQFIGPDGALITESLRDYTRKSLRRQFASLDDFLRKWSSAEKKSAVIAELERQGVFFDALAAEVSRDCGPFDLVCHIAFDQPLVSRAERARRVRQSAYFDKYGQQARAVLSALLDKFADGGIEDIEDTEVLRVDPMSQFGTPVEIVGLFGGPDSYAQAVRGLSETLYAA